MGSRNSNIYVNKLFIYLPFKRNDLFYITIYGSLFRYKDDKAYLLMTLKKAGSRVRCFEQALLTYQVKYQILFGVSVTFVVSRI